MRYWVVGIFVLCFDQLTKYWVTKGYSPRESVEIIPGMLWLTRVHNYGAAFGLFSGRVLLLILASLVVVAATLVHRRKILELGPLAQWGLTLALSGALGNLVDRVFRGYVVDFIDVRFWPVFNVADAAVAVGVFLVGWQCFMVRPHRGEGCLG